MRSICHWMEIRHIGDGMASLLIGTPANVLPMKRVDPPKKHKVKRDNGSPYLCFLKDVIPLQYDFASFYVRTVVFLYIQGLLQGFSLTLLTLVTVV